jgi:hypothetical protein
MSDQLALDTVIAHLRTQGRRSMLSAEEGEDQDTCAYRSSDGCKCSIGVLIPDDLYDHSMEHRSPIYIVERLGRKLLSVNRDLLLELQTLHDEPLHWDNTGFSSKGEEIGYRIATKHNLKYPRL